MSPAWTPDWYVGLTLVACGSVVIAWAFAYKITRWVLAAWFRLEQRRDRRAAKPDPHAPITLTTDELHAVHVAIAFAVALGRLHDDTYVIQVRACPEHGRDLVVTPADLAGFDSLADLPKEWVS